jgi:hypothetical protein
MREGRPAKSGRCIALWKNKKILSGIGVLACFSRDAHLGRSIDSGNSGSSQKFPKLLYKTDSDLEKIIMFIHKDSLRVFMHAGRQ